MATIIEMPKLSDTMTVGTVASWLVKEGDTVISGDVIAEIETDKATMELEAFEDGVLLKQIVGEGEQVPIGGPIAAIGEKGEEVEIPEAAPPPPKEEKRSSREDAKTEKKAEVEAKPAAADKPKEAPTAREEAVAAAEPAPQSEEKGERIRISPLARKLAAQLGVDIHSVQGSGPQGRIVKKDIQQAAERGPQAPEGRGAAPSKPPAPKVDTPIGVDRELPVSTMRSVIAQRLVESKTTVPHFYLEIEVEASQLISLRQSVNAELAELAPEQGGFKFSVNDFILKASIEAIRRVPAMNRSWAGSSIKQSGAVHLAFGVALEDGLVTPVIRNAESKSLKQIASEAKDLIGRARGKKLKPDEMTGSTFTVTNLGMYGVSSFYGIINPPNAGILSVGATLSKPVVSKDGQIVAGQIMTVGLSGDHRVIDGAVGAEFLQALKRILETPALILV